MSLEMSGKVLADFIKGLLWLVGVLIGLVIVLIVLVVVLIVRMVG